MAEKEAGIELEGVITETLKDKFLVQINRTGLAPLLVTAHLAGKLRKNFIRLTAGDRVKVEVSPYDTSRGRITYRVR